MPPEAQIKFQLSLWPCIIMFFFIMGCGLKHSSIPSSIHSAEDTSPSQRISKKNRDNINPDEMDSTDEVVAYQRAIKSKDFAVLHDFIQRFPNGIYSDEIRILLEEQFEMGSNLMLLINCRIAF